MRKSLPLIFASLFLVLSCNKDSDPAPAPTIGITATTGDATDITCFNATLAGQLVFSGMSPKDCDFGFLYGESAGLTFDNASRAYVQSKEYPDGKISKTITDLQMNSKYYYCVFAYYNNELYCGSEKSFTTKQTIVLSESPVDLGLSVKWDSKNIGAAKPSDAGLYFAWGDTVGQTWNGKKWSGTGFYNSVDFKRDVTTGELKPESDAARVILKGDWRMPTVDEMKELNSNCTTNWVENLNGTGVSGYLFSSKVEGHTDACIFIPAVGYGSNDILKDAINAVWSSSSEYNQSESEVWGKGLMLEGKYGIPGTMSTSNVLGFPIRAVTGK